MERTIVYGPIPSRHVSRVRNASARPSAAHDATVGLLAWAKASGLFHDGPFQPTTPDQADEDVFSLRRQPLGTRNHIAAPSSTPGRSGGPPWLRARAVETTMAWPRGHAWHVCSLDPAQPSSVSSALLAAASSPVPVVPTTCLLERLQQVHILSPP